MRNEILYRGFENIPTRQGRGGYYQYVRWQDVADRMNEAFGTSWSSEVVSQDIIGNNIIVRVRVTIFDSDTATMTSQEGFGGAPNDDRAEAGNPFKAAYSKALKDACKKWGLALFLEEEGESGGHITPESLPAGYHGKEYGVPPKTTPQPAAATASNLAPEAQHMAPSSGGLQTPAGVGLPTPPMSRPVAESVVVRQEVPQAPQAVERSIPTPPPVMEQVVSTQPPATPQGLPTPPQTKLKEDMPMSKVSTISTGEPARISDVQKAALHGILSYKDVVYETLVQEAFEANGIARSEIPGLDDLTYQEAVCVVKYGNDKFRRR